MFYSYRDISRYRRYRLKTISRQHWLRVFFEEIQSDPVKLAVIGCGCSVATQPVAAISSYWNIPQVNIDPLYIIMNCKSNQYFCVHITDINIATFVLNV